MRNGEVGIGTGNKFSSAVIIVCGVAALIASFLSFLSIWLQAKNYRKPLLQRYVIRILLMVPIYSAASWASLTSLTVAFYIDPLRDIYEAFTIYTFFQLLINFIGGERALIIMMHGRAPVSHPWPINRICSKVDISDPHTFLAIKRGILQYAWIKPLLAIATIIMKSTGTYKEGYLGIDSGYLWSGIIYNVSVSLSLYSLAMFWVCMSDDLKPFRPVPKFLCIKLIIFASYWQGFFLSILQFLGAIPNDVQGYTADNLAAAIQDALICCEMPLFAIAHWYAFSWHDYADITISSARMPVKYALRDAFGIRDLIQDTKETLAGENYDYRSFDTTDDVLTHEESESRAARMKQGMRYARNGKGKYWIPKPGEASSRTPLLPDQYGASGSSSRPPSHGTMEDGSVTLDQDDEALYQSARALEFGDWNYPVVTAHVVSGDRWLNRSPNLLTTSANRNLLHPTEANKRQRERRIEEDLKKGMNRKKSSSEGESSPVAPRAPLISNLLRRNSESSSKSAASGRSQLVDLVVEDTEAEEAERVRARKEGGTQWNVDEPRHFVTYDDEDQGEDIRKGFEPNDINPEEHRPTTSGSDGPSGSREGPSHYGDMDESHVWGSSPRSK